MTAPKDLTRLKHMLVPSTLHFYYETAPDGTSILRHIRVYKRTFQVPTDGITIDTVPPDSVGTDEIKDGSVETRDLSAEVQDLLSQMTLEPSTDPTSLLG